MICSDFFDDLIDGSNPPDLLGELLECRLGINKKRLLKNIRQSRVHMLENELSRSLESMIEIESPDDRLESIGEDIWIIMPLRIVLTTRYLYRLGEMEPMCDLSEIATTHEC